MEPQYDLPDLRGKQRAEGTAALMYIALTLPSISHYNATELKYNVDEGNKIIGVQIPIDIFKKTEEVLENYALVELMKENEGEEILSVKEAKAYYDKVENDTVILERALHRKKFYRYFL